MRDSTEYWRLQMASKLTLIIVLYNNEANEVISLVKSVLAGTKIEVIIVNNGWVKNGSLLSRETQITNYIINRENMGFAKACNIGANIAKTRYLLFLNPDLVVEKKNFKNVLNFMNFM